MMKTISVGRFTHGILMCSGTVRNGKYDASCRFRRLGIETKGLSIERNMVNKKKGEVGVSKRKRFAVSKAGSRK